MQPEQISQPNMLMKQNFDPSGHVFDHKYKFVWKTLYWERVQSCGTHQKKTETQISYDTYIEASLK